MGQLARWVDRTREGEQTLYDKYMRIIIIIIIVHYRQNKLSGYSK